MWEMPHKPYCGGYVGKDNIIPARIVHPASDRNPIHPNGTKT